MFTAQLLTLHLLILGRYCVFPENGSPVTRVLWDRSIVGIKRGTVFMAPAVCKPKQLTISVATALLIMAYNGNQWILYINTIRGRRHTQGWLKYYQG